MIKKQLLCSSVVLGLLVMSKLYSNNGSEQVSATEGQTRMAVSPVVEKDSVVVEEENKNEYFSSLSFANETLPVEDKKIESKMKRHLQQYAYSKLRTYRLHQHAAQSLPTVAKILKEHGIPEDFKYIPLVESGFKRGTSSIKGASGYWQFMPATARAFGLRVDREVDERQDIGKSTHAAAKYIKSLYREFGNWTLVAAAYNVGEGRLLKAMKAQQEEDYYKLQLNKETGSYVYKLISMKEIIENPTEHGYKPTTALLAQVAQEQDGMNVL